MGDDGKTVAAIVGAVLFILIGIPVGSIYLNQCVFGCGDSLHVQVSSIHLLTHPTDNVLFGWEWLFGKPADEISVKVQSGWCVARSKRPQAIKQGQIIWSDLAINTFFQNGFYFRLIEVDGGLEGRNDYSEKVHILENKMASMRQAFDNGMAESIELNYLVTVKGANIFQENRWFGFLAENLCIGVLDFAAGPWTSKILGKAILLKSGEMARLYKTVKMQYKNGILTKRSLFKSLITYQLRTGVKKAILNPAERHMNDLIKEWALSTTVLDENIKEMVEAVREDDSYSISGKEGLDLYTEVKNEIDRWAGYVERFTNSLEFCLSDILPPSRDARYHVKFLVTR